MKDQLFKELTALHEKVAALKMYDRENAAMLTQYVHNFEALLTKLLTFNADAFKEIAASYHKNAATGDYNAVIDVHDDTANSNGFYDTVENLNDQINDSIEIINGL